MMSSFRPNLLEDGLSNPVADSADPIADIRSPPNTSGASHAWFERDVDVDNLEYFERVPKRSHFEEMRLDTARYMPLAAGFVQRDSLWEVKALLPASESDDSRPILFRRDRTLPGLFSVLGGKIDNVYDIERELSEALAADAAAGSFGA